MRIYARIAPYTVIMRKALLFLLIGTFAWYNIRKRILLDLMAYTITALRAYGGKSLNKAEEE